MARVTGRRWNGCETPPVAAKGFEPVKSSIVVGSAAGARVDSLIWPPKTSEHARGNEVELGFGIP